MGCRKLTEHFSVRKTAISNILKDSKNLRSCYEFFKGSYKECRHEKYHVINKVLYKWYGKCTSENVYPEGLLLQERTMEVAKRLEQEELTDFTASNGWLGKWRQTFGVREKRLRGEADEVSTKTVQFWIERLPELCQDYTTKNTVISPDFLVRKFCGKAQFPHSFGRFARKYMDTVAFRKISTPGNQVKLRYFS